MHVWLIHRRSVALGCRVSMPESSPGLQVYHQRPRNESLIIGLIEEDVLPVPSLQAISISSKQDSPYFFGSGA